MEIVRSLGPATDLVQDASGQRFVIKRVDTSSLSLRPGWTRDTFGVNRPIEWGEGWVRLEWLELKPIASWIRHQPLKAVLSRLNALLEYLEGLERQGRLHGRLHAGNLGVDGDGGWWVLDDWGSIPETDPAQPWRRSDIRSDLYDLGRLLSGLVEPFASWLIVEEMADRCPHPRAAKRWLRCLEYRRTSPPLGGTREMRQVEEWLDHLRQGRGVRTLVYGPHEADVSSFLQEVERRALEQGFAVTRRPDAADAPASGPLVACLGDFKFENRWGCSPRLFLPDVLWLLRSRDPPEKTNRRDVRRAVGWTWGILHISPPHPDYKKARVAISHAVGWNEDLASAMARRMIEAGLHELHGSDKTSLEYGLPSVFWKHCSDIILASVPQPLPRDVARLACGGMVVSQDQAERLLGQSPDSTEPPWTAFGRAWNGGGGFTFSSHALMLALTSTLNEADRAAACAILGVGEWNIPRGSDAASERAYGLACLEEGLAGYPCHHKLAKAARRLDGVELAIAWAHLAGASDGRELLERAVPILLAGERTAMSRLWSSAILRAVQVSAWRRYGDLLAHLAERREQWARPRPDPDTAINLLMATAELGAARQIPQSEAAEALSKAWRLSHEAHGYNVHWRFCPLFESLGLSDWDEGGQRRRGALSFAEHLGSWSISV